MRRGWIFENSEEGVLAFSNCGEDEGQFNAFTYLPMGQVNLTDDLRLNIHADQLAQRRMKILLNNSSWYFVWMALHGLFFHKIQVPHSLPVSPSSPSSSPSSSSSQLGTVFFLSRSLLSRKKVRTTIPTNNNPNRAGIMINR